MLYYCAISILTSKPAPAETTWSAHVSGPNCAVKARTLVADYKRRESCAPERCSYIIAIYNLNSAHQLNRSYYCRRHVVVPPECRPTKTAYTFHFMLVVEGPRCRAKKTSKYFSRRHAQPVTAVALRNLLIPGALTQIPLGTHGRPQRRAGGW